MNHLKFTLRQLAKHPGFSAVAVITLALGIGVNTTVFSMISALIYRIPPFREPNRLVSIYASTRGNPYGGLGLANVRDLSAQNSVLEGFATYNYFTPNLAFPGSPPDRGAGFGISGDFFKILGVNPLLGRFLTQEETLQPHNDTVVVSERFWRQKLGSNPDVIGSKVRIDGAPMTIIGVMPADFKDEGWTNLDVWEANAWTNLDWAKREGYGWQKVISRLRPGVTLKEAQAQMDTIAARLAHDYPATNAGTGIHLELMDEARDRYGHGQEWTYMALTFIVLLIACANLAALQLARTSKRTYEYAIRIALGASRGQLIRQLLLESIVLALMGGAAGLVVAVWGNQMLGKGLDLELELDHRVLAFNLVASLLTGVGFGLTPAWSASRTDVNHVLKRGARGVGEDGSKHRFRNALVTGELALALGLLAGASFFIRGMQEFSRPPTGLGWSSGDLLTGSFMLPYTPAYANDDQTRAGIERIAARLSAVPGVDGVGIAGSLPVFRLAGFENFGIEGQPAPTRDRRSYVQADQVSPGFFSTLGMKLLAGRDFTPDDRSTSQHVVIICAKMARKFWPKGDAIGHRIGSGDPTKPDWREIVGIVDDIKFPGVPEGFQTSYQTYHPVTQDLNQHWLNFALHCRVPPESLVLAARRAVAEADPDLAISNVQTVSATIEESRAGSYSLETILTIAAVLGLFLSLIGIYAVIANLVVQRTNEIGVRIALGAPLKAIFWLLLSSGVRMAAYGTVIGLLIAFAITRVLDQKMPYMHGQDPSLILGMAGLLACATILASWLPALRATRINPLEALRAE
jgi:putative ABC transport system permease protein